jgi:radical SAM superfamily enzyme YgiQ (UPF0313 family)
MLVAPRSTGGNFEYVAIFRQGTLFLSGALRDWEGKYLYDRQIWFEDRSGKIDPEKDLDGVDLLLVTALINEAPRAYEIAREAKRYHPQIKTLGGGPHMGPLPEEAIREGNFDVIVQREGEDVIGILCDLLLDYEGDDLRAELGKIGGLAYCDADGKIVETRPHRHVIPADYVKLPDYDAVRDLTAQMPLAAGVIETVRGCTENCSFCEVIQQFKGYRMVSRETEVARLQQLQRLAADGKIYRSPRDGRFAVFVSDDLHSPPFRATKFRNERLERARNWRHHTQGMFLVSQNRAELGSDPEMIDAYLKMGMDMLYLGVESSNAENLALVRKRQEPGQVHSDLAALKKAGFTVVAMTIIGLPFDTEESIMEMADWIRGLSSYQTANLLTPLPATINWPNPEKGWEGLVPLDEDGSLLPPGKMRPYHLYTGRQLVHQDPRWGLQESRELYDRYVSRLRPVDRLYERIYRAMKVKALREPALAVPERVPAA